MSDIDRPERVTQSRVIERIIESCKEAGTPELEVKYEQTGLWLVFPFRVRQTVAEAEIPQETTQEKILVLLSAQPTITRKELAARIGLSADGIKYHMEKMKSAGLIRHVGPTKAGHWEILK